MQRLRLAVLAASAIVAASAFAQSDTGLSIHGGAPDLLLQAANSSTRPADVVRSLLATPGLATDGALATIAGAQPTQCPAAKSVAIHPNGKAASRMLNETAWLSSAQVGSTSQMVAPTGP